MFPIVPQPVEVTELAGEPTELTSGTRIVTGSSAEELEAGVMLAGSLGSFVSQAIAVEQGESGAGPLGAGEIALRLDPGAGPAGSESDERYTLESRGGAVLLAAATVTGLVRAMATLGQLLAPTATGGGYLVPAVRVLDAPRYPWRGLSLDVARHFFGVDDVKRVLSLMTRYKLNVLHLHLSDDQGWRLQIPSRPLLTERASGTSVGGGPGGYITTDEFLELQLYARSRGIAVVPEIDVPGHTNAALHAYPELNADGVAKPVYTGIDVGFSTLDASLPATEKFLRDVLGDVAAMTHGPWVHLGGDEAHDTSREDYETIIGLAAQILREAGKIPVGWQEFAASPASSSAVVQLWDMRLELEPLAAAARAGAQVLLSPADRVYLDMKYDAESPLGLDWAGHIELRDAYEWEPTEAVPGLEPEAICGVEAAVWTETLENLDELATMLLPRLTAVAEVAWTLPERRDWDSYARRISGQWRRWERHGLRWYRTPQVDWAP